MKIYDCFTFFNEFDILDLRFNILDPVVDYFVIVEANRNFKGDSKPFNFFNNKDRYSKFSHKIIYKQVDLPVSYSELPFINPPKSFDDKCINQIYELMLKSKLFDRFTQPHYGRNFFIKECPKRGLEQCDDSDLIISSDVDEIPNPEILRRLNEFYDENEFYSFTQLNYNYYLNVTKKSHINNISHVYLGAEPYTGIKTNRWKGSKMASYKLIKDYSLNELRAQPNNDIEQGGWHFSNMGGASVLKEKLISGGTDRDYSKIPDMVNDVDKFLKTLSDITYNGDILEKVEIDDSYPEYILNNLNKYKNMIL
jgi:beta-1,4-mannosyl-glycoprotein beta-1,4-N-acetylglucosaminyltransferase